MLLISRVEQEDDILAPNHSQTIDALLHYSSSLGDKLQKENFI